MSEGDSYTTVLRRCDDLHLHFVCIGKSYLCKSVCTDNVTAKRQVFQMEHCLGPINETDKINGWTLIDQWWLVIM